ncbi:MAG: dual specificity protein phosphatase family protein, partial [Sulfobacillus sp.]
MDFEIQAAPANEIIPRLWLGDYRAAERFPFDVIVNCTVEVPLSNRGMTYRLSVHDDLQPESLATMLNSLPHVTRVIRESLSLGHQVLVHCYAGMQRSATVVCAYLMRYHGMSMHNAMWLIRQKRPIAFFPQANFGPSLRSFEYSLSLR